MFMSFSKTSLYLSGRKHFLALLKRLSTGQTINDRTYYIRSIKIAITNTIS